MGKKRSYLNEDDSIIINNDGKWVRYESKSHGKEYWCNTVTGQTSWVKPQSTTIISNEEGNIILGK